jgi:hypothetical protein
LNWNPLRHSDIQISVKKRRKSEHAWDKTSSATLNGGVGLLPISDELVRHAAVREGVCVRPVLRRVTDRTTRLGGHGARLRLDPGLEVSSLRGQGSPAADDPVHRGLAPGRGT